MASIEASKKRHAEQKAQGLIPDNQQVFVRVRPSQKSLWGSFKEGVTYMANSLNEGVRQMDFLPSLPFSMAYGMPSSEKRITSSEDEALEKALSAMYGKLEEADHFVDELKDYVSIPSDVPSCASTTMNTTPTPTSAGQKTSQPAVRSNEDETIIGAVLGALGALAVVTGAVYWYTKNNQGERERAGNPSGVVVENDDEQYEMEIAPVDDGRVEDDNDNRA